MRSFKGAVQGSHACHYQARFLRSLLRLAGRKIDKRFYFSRRRRAACSYVLLRNSFSGKWGSFSQRPLALNSVRRLQRPPTNVTVRCLDALAHLRALPSQAPRHCIYVDPPCIFPGRSMNYYGTRSRRADGPRKTLRRRSSEARFYALLHPKSEW